MEFCLLVLMGRRLKRTHKILTPLCSVISALWSVVYPDGLFVFFAAQQSSQFAVARLVVHSRQPFVTVKVSYSTISQTLFSFLLLYLMNKSSNGWHSEWCNLCCC